MAFQLLSIVNARWRIWVEVNPVQKLFEIIRASRPRQYKCRIEVFFLNGRFPHQDSKALVTPVWDQLGYRLEPRWVGYSHLPGQKQAESCFLIRIL